MSIWVVLFVASAITGTEVKPHAELLAVTGNENICNETAKRFKEAIDVEKAKTLTQSYDVICIKAASFTKGA